MPAAQKVRHVVFFGGLRSEAPALEVDALTRRRRVDTTLADARAGRVGALVLDARHPAEFTRAMDLLRAMYDDARGAPRSLHPARVLALVATGDVEAAFAFGRYGLGRVLEARDLLQLEGCIDRILRSDPQPLPISAAGPLRTARLSPRAPNELPTVTIGYAHAPETLAALARYDAALTEASEASTVFADVATILRTLVDEGLSCQTNLACKAGATHSGQYIGSFAFYRELRRTRYARIPDHPDGAIAMDVFIAVDEVLHEALHLLFLANRIRAGREPEHTLVAEEFSLTWWQGVIHNRVFPEWIVGPEILEINDDFLVCERNQEPFRFWTVGHVFDAYASYPWVPRSVEALPDRGSYIGQRPDVTRLQHKLTARPDAGFLFEHGSAGFVVPGPFDGTPSTPLAL